MSEGKSSGASAGGGIGFGGALTLLFIGLKLGGCISWSWWWVLSPLWLPLAVVLAVIVAGVAGVVLLWAGAWAAGRVGKLFAGRR